MDVIAREAPAATMVVTRDPGELFLLRHTAGDDAIAFVERINPATLEPAARSADLAGGPAWPGSLAAHANGSLYVVFGNHAHRLAPDLSVLASADLPRNRPYNGFVILPDGCLATKDFAGSRPGHPVPAARRQPCELIVLEPEHLEVVGRAQLPEPSIARLSASGEEIYVVGDTSVHRARWSGALTIDGWQPRYRTREGQTYGWDCVLAGGAAWFQDDGEGSEAYDGTLRGHGVSSAPLQLLRADLGSGTVTAATVGEGPGGLAVNPPVVDPVRGVAVGYDSGTGVLQAFASNGPELRPLWRRRQDHGGHLVLFPSTGELVTGDYDAARRAEQVVVLQVESGEELARMDTGSPLQSVLFPAAGWDRDVYLCSFSTVSRLRVG